MRTLHTLASACLATGVLFAQTQTSATTGSQTYTGLLLDANCAQITSMSGGADASRNRVGDPGEAQYRSNQATSTDRTAGTSGTGSGNVPGTSADRSSSTVARDSQRAGAANTTGSGISSGTTGSGLSSGTTGSGLSSGTTGSGLSSGSAGTGPSTSTTGSAHHSSGTASTQSGASGSAHHSSGSTSTHSGTAAHGSTTSPGNTAATGHQGTHSSAASPGSSTMTGAHTGTSSTMTSSTGTTSGSDSARGMTGSANRMAEGSTGATDWSACRVTPATSSYALYSNGRVIRLDAASTQRINDQLRSSRWHENSSGANARDLNVSISGSMSGDNLSVSSVSIR